MKTDLFLSHQDIRVIALLSAMIAGVINLNATTKWRVNGNPGILGNPTINFLNEIQDIVTNNLVSDGDTIIIEPMNNGSSYTGTQSNVLYLTKRLYIFGSGYFLNENDSTQANKVESKMNHLEFSAGSSGSEIYGINFTGRVKINTGVSDVKINNCRFTHSYTYLLEIHGNNARVERCKFSGTTNNAGIYINSGNNLIMNNIIDINPQSSSVNDIEINAANGSAVIKNNVLNFHSAFANSTISSNIFTEYPITLSDNGTSNFSYNVVVDFPDLSVFASSTANVNVLSAQANTIFKSSTHPEEKFQLAAGSPAIGKGENGIDCGAFSGTNPYELSGMPPIPAIFYLTNDACSPGNTLRVNIKAKAHN